MKKYDNEKSKIIRESIGEAILTILKEKKFDEISICEICEKAGVGRTTYYRYYGNKGGKEEAVYHWLLNRWDVFIDGRDLPLEEKDHAFLAFIFEAGTEIALLRDNQLLHVLDSFILRVYGPEDGEDSSTGMYYLKYAGAGIWMGMIRAVISKDFSDPADEVKQKFQDALRMLASAG